MKKILTYYLAPYYRPMAVGFSIKFTGTILDLLLPWTLAHMIDYVIPTGRQSEIFLWGGFMVLCSVLAAVFNITANRMASRVASDTIYKVREDLFAKVMYLSHENTDRLTRPSLISRLTSDTYYVHQMLARIQRLGVRAPILLIGGVAMTMILDPILACVLLATMPPLALVVVFVSKKGIPLFTALQSKVDGFVRLVREDIAGIRVIKALSKEDYERERFDKINREVMNAERKANMTTAVSNPAMNIFLNLGLVSVIIAGACRVNEGTSEVGKILAFITYFTIILNAMMSISRMFVMISKASASAGRIVQVLDTRDEREPGTFSSDSKETPDTQVPHVEFDHVSFSYHKTRDNIKDIHFSLMQGETLGIIGSTGSGKTTIINLLMGFYQSYRGNIRINGQDIRTMDFESLRHRFGAVFQNDVIFEDTIFENINMGRNLTHQQADQALGYARAWEFVAEKGGLDKELDIKGANLSGGQKQRILIARALAAGPEILILDDSSSALDYKTDAALRQELKDHFQNTTCIIIAQRVSSVMNADHILVLEEGEEIGYGSHEHLMEHCPIYREIENSQMGVSQSAQT
ncbi:MAG: ABC transporter ATP-binding protein [Hungatella sp.]|nr:ABC transporter ATP-binding protein [Hungatella sp.]